MAAARREARPRVSGEDALRAMRLADQVLRSLEAHRWDAEPAAAAAALPASRSRLRTPGPPRLADQEPAGFFQRHRP